MQTDLTILNAYISNPRSPKINFDLGRWYEEQKHFSPAVSFYIRTAEFAEEEGFEEDEDLFKLAYEALIRAHICIDNVKTRELTAKYLLQRAIALDPTRPEAYYLLSKFELYKSNYAEAYMLSCAGQSLTPSNSLHYSVGYIGPKSFLFPRALSAHHWGRGNESRIILQEILSYHKNCLSAHEAKTVKSLLYAWGVGGPEVADVPYIKEKNLNLLKWKFDGVENIEKNYSQAYQDMFVLTVLNGKKNGTYLEIGSEEPQYKSNTNLLESQFNWKGVSVEIDEPEVKRFKASRLNPIICADATQVDYDSLLKQTNLPTDIDYLQIDTEPSSTSFEVLLSIPFDKYRFAVVTFEHDHAVDFSRTYREKSRRYLKSQGYEMIVPDIGPTDWYSFEDWWVHPELVDVQSLKEKGMVISPHPTISFGANDVREYFLHYF